MNRERNERINSLKNLAEETQNKINLWLLEDESEKTIDQEFINEEIKSLENLRGKIKRFEEKAIKGQLLI